MNNSPAMFVPIVIVVIAYIAFSFFRQRKQVQAVNDRKNALLPGAKVMLSSGVYGVVHSKDDDNIFIEIAPGIITQWNPLAVAKVISQQVEQLQSVSDTTTTIGTVTTDTLISDTLHEQATDTKEA